MSILLPYICCGLAIVVGAFAALAGLGVRDCVRGAESRNWGIVSRGVGLLLAAVATVVASYKLWDWVTGAAWP
jgi:hypothetical protein